MIEYVDYVPRELVQTVLVFLSIIPYVVHLFKRQQEKSKEIELLREKRIALLEEEILVKEIREALKLVTPPDRGSSIQPPASFQRQIKTIRCPSQFLNCPNCGAPVNNNRCEYCGTDFSSFIQEE